MKKSFNLTSYWLNKGEIKETNKDIEDLELNITLACFIDQ